MSPYNYYILTKTFWYVNIKNDSYGNRTRVTAVKGRCLNRLTKEPHIFRPLGAWTPRVGLEPTTPRLTAVCSTIELSRITSLKVCSYTFKTIHCLYPSTSVLLSYDVWSSPRPISNRQLHTLLCFHLCPIYLVVFKGSYFFRMGYLILRGASRLDAFSVYPVPTWLLGHAPGDATDTPEVSPSRSSRTKDSSSQISYAHAG